MLAASVPVIMILLGILMFALATSPKLQKIGEWMFFAGFIGIAIAFASRLLTFGGH